MPNYMLTYFHERLRCSESKHGHMGEVLRASTELTMKICMRLVHSNSPIFQYLFAPQHIAAPLMELK